VATVGVGRWAEQQVLEQPGRAVLRLLQRAWVVVAVRAVRVPREAELSGEVAVPAVVVVAVVEPYPSLG